MRRFLLRISIMVGEGGGGEGFVKIKYPLIFFSTYLRLKSGLYSQKWYLSNNITQT